MKFIVFIFMFYISFSSYLLSNEIIDCSQFDKISAKYVECKAKNLKSNLNKKQSEMKSKVENINKTETGKKIKKSTFGQKLLKFKNSKTGSDFLKKMTIEDNIKKLNIVLPKAADPVGSYVATKISGKLLYISGQISMNDKGELIKGKLGKDLKTEDGYNAAKRCALSIVAQAKKACNDDLSLIKSCVKLTGYVNSTEDFVEQPKVINGASDMIASIFGDIGMHTRAAVSANSLPLGVAVEVDAIFEIK